jgi:dihydrofolate reductase
MGKTIMGAIVSLDGYIADEDDRVGSLFDWLGNGDVELKFTEKQEHPARTTQASRDFMLEVYPRIGAVVIGRRLFDQTNGWGGVPVAGDHAFVVTHKPPPDWEFAGPDRVVDVGAGQIGGQALELGLIDEVVVNQVPVVFRLPADPDLQGPEGVHPSLVGQKAIARAFVQRLTKSSGRGAKGA